MTQVRTIIVTKIFSLTQSLRFAEILLISKAYILKRIFWIAVFPIYHAWNLICPVCSDRCICESLLSHKSSSFRNFLSFSYLQTLFVYSDIESMINTYSEFLSSFFTNARKCDHITFLY